MSDALIQTSFASGELAPSIFARTDLAKYHSGAARMRNFFVDYRSGASTRQGGRFVIQALQSDTNVRLIPYQYSSIATYIIEFGDFYCRFITDGGAVLEASLGISAINNSSPMQVTVPGHSYAIGDQIFIKSAGGMPQASNRYYQIFGISGNVLSLSTVNGLPVNSAFYGTYTSGGTIARVYTVVSPYAAADLALLKFSQISNEMTLTHSSYPVYTLAATAPTSWTFTKTVFKATILPPTSLTALTSSAGSTNYSYVVTAVDANGQESSPSDPVYLPAAVNIGVTAGTITLEWVAAIKANDYNVYKAEISFSGAIPTGASYGFIGTTKSTSFVDSNIVPDFTQTPPIVKNPFAPGQVTSIVPSGGAAYVQTSTTVSITSATGTGFKGLVVVNSSGVPSAVIIIDAGQDYAATDTVVFADSGGGAGATGTLTIGPTSGLDPGCSCYFQQRQYFAASIDYPTSFWATQPGLYNNFNISDPIIASDAITGTLVSLQVNAIKSMLPMPGGLIMLTSQGAWQLTSGQSNIAANSAVTPMNATANPQAYNGASDVTPIPVNYDILYVQAKGSIVRDLAYNIYANIYTGADVSVLSNHLFLGHQITEWAYAEEPFKAVWSIRDDGILLSLTYVKEQEIYGWARHDTLGLYKSVATVREGQVDAVYVVAKRYIGGQWVQMIERFADRFFPYGAEDAFSVDCGSTSALTYPAAGLTASTSSGSVTFTANAPVFNSGNVGSILRMGGGIATISALVSPTVLTGTWTQSPTEVVPNDPLATPVPAVSGDWSLTPQFTTFYGLDYLEGQTVSILADGGVVTPQVVTNGKIVLANPASKVTVGLPFTAQLQTMYLDVGGGETVQGKRKKIAALTVRCVDTRGIYAGRTFSTLVPIKQLNAAVVLGQPVPLLTGDERIVMDPLWDVPGQICLQVTDPLPATVLGVIPEVVIGDK